MADWFLERRNRFQEQYAALPMPLFRYGIAIFSKPPETLLQAEDTSLRNEAINQQVEGARIISFFEALQDEQYSSLLDEYWMKLAGDTKLSLLHGAHIETGVLVHIPRRQCVSSPIYLSQYMNTARRFTHVLVVAEEGSSVVIVDQLVGDAVSLRSHVVELVLHDRARVQYVSTARLGHTQAGYIQKVASVGESADVAWLDYISGSGFIRSSTVTMLGGAGGRVQDRAGFMNQADTFDIDRTILHQAPGTKSNMLTRGVIYSKAKTIWRGTIMLDPNSQNAEAFQQADVLLNDESAEADVIPVLEVHTDAVQARHAATTNQINPDTLFYLTSRGLEEQEARRLLLEGFMNVVTQDLHEYIPTI